MKFFWTFMLAILCGCSYSQISSLYVGRLNGTPSTAIFPLLQIAQDARAGALGDAGVATSPDAYAQFYNPGKIPAADSTIKVALSYAPWLRQLVSGNNLYCFSGNMKVPKNWSIGAGYAHLQLGTIQFSTIGSQRLSESVLNITAARKINTRWGIGVNAKYIKSNIPERVVSGASPVIIDKHAPAFDVGIYRHSVPRPLTQMLVSWSFGASLQNLGPRQNVSELGYQYFMPARLKIGSRTDANHQSKPLTFSLVGEVSKELVPTSPLLLVDSTGQVVYDNDGNYIVAAGKDPDRSSANALFTSFYDAPGTPMFDENGDLIKETPTTYQIEKGSVFREELREITFSIGFEARLSNWLILRSGMFNEHYNKGDRKFWTFGLGILYKRFFIEGSYLKPFYVNKQQLRRSPLHNTFRFSLGAVF